MISGVQIVVPQELVRRTMQLICARLGDDNNLSAGSFAVLCSVSIAQDIEFPNRLDAQQFAARAGRLHVIFSCSRVFDSVKKKNVLLRPVTRHCKIISVGGIGHTSSAGLLHGEIHDSGIHWHEQIKTAAIERQILHLLLPSDEARDIARRHDYDRCVGILANLLADLSDLQRKINLRILPHYEMHSGSHFFREAFFMKVNLIFPNGQREHTKATGVVGRDAAHESRINALYVYGDA